MSTDATLGYNSQMYWSTNGTTWTKIGQTKDLTGPEPEVGDVNITNNDSPDNTKEYKGGMIEPGEQEFSLVYTPDQMAELYDTLGDGVTYYFAEVYADSSGWKYRGYLKKAGIETQTEDGVNMSNITLKVSGKPAFYQVIAVALPTITFTVS